MEIKKSLSADLEGKKGTGLLMGFVLALSAMFGHSMTRRLLKQNLYSRRRLRRT